MYEILKLLENDCRLTTEQLAAMLDMSAEQVSAEIDKYTRNDILIGYQALINWDKIDVENVTALIEVKVTPQRGEGFDRIAERIYQYDEVESVYLMSGSFDLTVIISGKSLKSVALFVAQKLAIIDGVTGTATHFILKKYKEKHKVFEKQPEQEERMMFV